MIDARESHQPAARELPRRRFLACLGGLVGGLLVGLGAWGSPGRLALGLTGGRSPVSRRTPRELALREADLHRPHDLAG